MKIYLDVLILINLFITYFLLKGTARLAQCRPRRWRLFLGSVAGGVYSLLILFDIDQLVLMGFRLAMGASLLFLTFFPGYRRTRQTGWRPFLKTAFYFTAVNFLFAGCMLAVWLFLPIPGMWCRNGVVYFQISALTLALSTIGAYLLLTLAAWLWNRRALPSERAELTVGLNHARIRCDALVDTGNKLVDLFTGLPVIVCEYGAVEPLLPPELRDFYQDPSRAPLDQPDDPRLIRMLRVVPVHMASGEMLLPAFRPDETLVSGRPCQALIAVAAQKLSDGTFQALLPAALQE